MITERPAEVDDRAVPGHWEGDLIIGKDSGSAIGTLVERTTRFVMLLHLPGDHGAEAVRDAIAANDQHPARRAAPLADLGPGHRDGPPRRRSPIATDLPIYFCDPHSPWQRGTNENTNGLLRQYFPKGTDLSVHTADDLDRRRRRAQRPTPQDPRLANPSRGPHRATLRTAPTSRCCDDQLNPPP